MYPQAKVTLILLCVAYYILSNSLLQQFKREAAGDATLIARNQIEEKKIVVKYVDF